MDQQHLLLKEANKILLRSVTSSPPDGYYTQPTRTSKNDYINGQELPSNSL